ncbi:MAG: IS110 family transposase [Planctomycetes bacterium]|nr:IS110 family transposase [Planctomycetota bacterium]
MVRYVGLDVHKRFIEVCILDGKGKVLFRGRADCDRQALERFARQRLKKSDRVALEATTNTWPVAEILRPFVTAVVVSNPLKTKAIAEAKIKTDKVDAQVLAHLLRCDYLPHVWQPDEQTQILRGLITHRTGLMTQRARHKNRIQCILGRLLIHPPCKVLWTKAGMAWLRQVETPPTERLVLDSELRQLAAVESELTSLDEQLIAIAGNEPRVRLLMTLPGVSHVVAIGLLAALGDIHRFRDGNHAASYLGLAPITRQSGNHCYHGRITKAGNSQARWLLTQSCQHVARHPGPLGAYFRRLAKRKNRQVAIVAVARKLVTIAYLMLKNNEPYRYAKPKLIAEKFTALDRATPTTRKPRKSKPGPSAQARAGLAAVYAHAGLPKATPPAELPDGEQRMLKEQKLKDFVSELYSPQTASAPTKSSAKKSGRPAGRSG